MSVKILLHITLIGAESLSSDTVSEYCMKNNT